MRSHPAPVSVPTAWRFAVLAALLLTGCASTRIISDDPNAEIYVDSRMVGIGEVRVDRVGPPRQVTVEAKKGGRTIGTREMRRSFTFMTIVWGVCSYYTGLYWGWYYPETVTIPVKALTAEHKAALKSLWQEPGQSVWMRPLN